MPAKTIKELIFEKNAQASKYLLPASLLGMGGLGAYGLYKALAPEPTMWDKITGSIPGSVKDVGSDLASILSNAGAAAGALPQYLPQQMFAQPGGALGFHGEGLPQQMQQQQMPMSYDQYGMGQGYMDQGYMDQGYADQGYMDYGSQLPQELSPSQEQLMAFSPYSI